MIAGTTEEAVIRRDMVARMQCAAPKRKVDKL